MKRARVLALGLLGVWAVVWVFRILLDGGVDAEREASADVHVERPAGAPEVATPREASVAGPAPDSSVAVARDARLAWLQRVEAVASFSDEVRGDRVWRRVSAARIQRFIEDPSLDPARRAQLQALLRDKEELEHDLTQAIRTAGVALPEESVRALKTAEADRLRAAILTVAGPELADRIHQEWNQLPTRLYAVEFVGEASLRGAPVTPEQALQINDVVDVVERSPLARRKADPVNVATGLTPYDEAIIGELSKVLSPDQRQALIDVRVESNVDRAARALLEARRREKRRLEPAPMK